MQNSQIRHEAYMSLKGHWLYPVLCTLLYMAVTSACSLIPGVKFVASLLVITPLAYGFTLTMQDVLHGDTSDEIVTRPFAIFKEYGRYLGGSLLVALFTLLWMLLLIVPGIIKALSYAMTPYIMRDNPDLPVRECIRRSQQMMDGHKADLFCLYLSFIGWALLCCLTLCIGFLWLNPYVYASQAKFYDELKAGQASAAPRAEVPAAE